MHFSDESMATKSSCLTCLRMFQSDDTCKECHGKRSRPLESRRGGVGVGQWLQVAAAVLQVWLRLATSPCIFAPSTTVNPTTDNFRRTCSSRQTWPPHSPTSAPSPQRQRQDQSIRHLHRNALHFGIFRDPHSAAFETARHRSRTPRSALGNLTAWHQAVVG